MSGPAAAIFLGFAWIVWKLLVAYLKTGYISGPSAGRKAVEEKKKQ